MDNRKKDGAAKSLKWFLIRRFFIIMFLIYVSEELLGIFYDKLSIGISMFLSDWHISISAGGNPVSFVLQALLYSLTTLLPSTVSGYVQGTIGQWMGNSMRIAVTSPLFVGKWGIVLRLIVIAVLFVMLLISLLPWILGAFYYYWVVTKQVNELIKEEKEKQLISDQKRNLLLSDIAHDIKTPLTTLCGYSKALYDGVVNEEKQREYLEAIHTKSMRMNELLTLLFEYVTMDSSGFVLHREEKEVGEFLRECVAALYTDFEENHITLDIDISEDAMSCQLDPVQMTRAITNLLNNAIRYGKDGGRVLVRLEDYVITVADDGMEIDREFAEHIFEPFSRADKARSTAGGSGLGLSIAYKIVQMHGGELRLRLDYGQGYTKAFQILLRG
ncbi:MAG: HAMP domain-containing histidine kinase [Lachnospiraceae bacterium]